MEVRPVLICFLSYKFSSMANLTGIYYMEEEEEEEEERPLEVTRANTGQPPPRQNQGFRPGTRLRKRHCLAGEGGD